MTDEPRDVRVTRPDGTTVRFGVIRDPDNDKPGETAWVAHPLEPYALAPGDRLQVGYKPAGASLRMVLPRGEQP